MRLTFRFWRRRSAAAAPGCCCPRPWLIAAITLLGCCDPVASAFLIAVAAFIVAAASATQDIVVDAFRVESLPENEQAAGMASYVAAYRVGALTSGAGALLVVTALRGLSFGDRAAWTGCYLAMAALVLIGVVATLLAVEPASSAAAEAEHTRPPHRNSIKRALQSALDSFRDFLTRKLAVAALAFVALFKLADALAFALLTPFVLDLRIFAAAACRHPQRRRLYCRRAGRFCRRAYCARLAAFGESMGRGYFCKRR